MSSSDDLAIEVLRHLNLAVKGINLYPAGHPSITNSISEAYKNISSILNSRDRMIIGLVEDVLVIDETPLYTLTDSLQEVGYRDSNHRPRGYGKGDRWRSSQAPTFGCCRY